MEGDDVEHWSSSTERDPLFMAGYGKDGARSGVGTGDVSEGKEIKDFVEFNLAKIYQEISTWRIW